MHTNCLELKAAMLAEQASQYYCSWTIVYIPLGPNRESLESGKSPTGSSNSSGPSLEGTTLLWDYPQLIP